MDQVAHTRVLGGFQLYIAGVVKSNLGVVKDNKHLTIYNYLNNQGCRAGLKELILIFAGNCNI